MNIKTSKIEKGFMLGVGVKYLASHYKGFVCMVVKKAEDRCKFKQEGEQ